MTDVVDRVFDLTRELDISGMIRLEMIAEPELAVAVLEHALAAPRIRNRVGFAVANWKSGFDPRPAVEPEPEPEPVLGPPTLAVLEQAWSLDQDAPAVNALLAAIGAALTHFGGFPPLQQELYRVIDPDV